jgi:hypothetical protein
MYSQRLLAVISPLLVLGSSAAFAMYTFSTMNDNVLENGTILTGINNAGEIVGYGYDADNNIYTFLDHYGYFENLNANPPAVNNKFLAINNVGGAMAGGIQNVGQPVGVLTSSGTTYGAILSSSASNPNIIFTDQPYADYPNSFLDPTTFTGINDRNEIVGVAQIGAAYGGFLLPAGYANYSTGGTVSGQPVAINHPNAGTNSNQGTVPNGINNVGTIVGNYNDSNGISHGFIYNNGNFTTLDVPASFGGVATGAAATLATGINNSGEVVGFYGDILNGASYGFVYETEGPDAGTYYTFSFPSSNYTYPLGINDQGTIVGYYVNANGIDEGFTAVDPPTSMMMRNINTGAFEVYDISGNKLGDPVASRTVGLDWRVAGYGDFSGKTNESGMLLRNSDTGAFEIYDISKNKLNGPVALNSLSMLGLDWQVAGIGDFSGKTNETDLLLRNTKTGAFEIYDVSDDKVTGAHALGPLSLDWQVVGVGDFSGNVNETDLLLRNSDTGAFEIYNISNNKLSGPVTLNSLSMLGPDWQVAGVGDFSSMANETDLLLRNTKTGAFEIYDISDNKVTASASLGQLDLSWLVAGFSDFGHHPGETDMLLRNNDTGEFKVWYIADNRLVRAASLGRVETEWQFSGLPSEPSIGPSTTFQIMGSSSSTVRLEPHSN